ncbi:MAG: nuclease-related domain-containing protein [Rubrivivax sp.]
MSEPLRSPIKDKPLRSPGQSLDEERGRLWEDKIENWALLALVMLVLAAMEWYRYFRPTPPEPWLVSVIALGLVGFAAFRFLRLRPKMRELRQGAEGERAVGQFLDRLRVDGYHVFHDVLADGFNLDHVVIGPGGIFTIETKTWSKPSHGDARIKYDGEQIVAGKLTPDRDPLIQASAQAGWLRALLSESTGRRLSVRPVVVFPGWYVDAGPGSQRDVWVMEPKGLPAFLANQQEGLRPEDVKLVSFHLSRYVRSQEREREMRR